MTTSNSEPISALLHERRVFPPRQAVELGFSRWHVGSMDEYRERHARSIREPEAFWGEVARDLKWFQPWSRVLEWNAPDARWFVGARTNMCYNCVDAHVQAGFGEETAIVCDLHAAGLERLGERDQVRLVGDGEDRTLDSDEIGHG